NQATARADELKMVSDFQAEMLAQINPTKAGDELTADVAAKFAEALAKANPPISESERARMEAIFERHWERINTTDAARELIDRTILRPSVETIEAQFADQPVVAAQLRQALATQYHTLGLFDAAEPLQVSALETRRRVLGDDHPDTLASIHEMGILLQGQGRNSEAESFFLEALEKRRRVLGDEHPDTLLSINGMQFLYQGQGMLAEAEPYALEVLETRRRVLGEEDVHTMLSISNMCVLLMYQGKLDEAEPLCREAMEKRRRVLGEKSGDTVISINILAYLLQAQGKYDEAEPLRFEAVEKSRQVFGSEHPDTLIAVNNLGWFLQVLGRLDEAEPYHVEALEIYTRVLGDEHPNTLYTVVCLGALRTAQGRYAEAIEFLEPVEPGVRATFTGAFAHVLARYLMSVGRARAGLGFDPEGFATAEADLIEAHELYVASRGEEDRGTRTCVKALADLYDEWAKAAPGRGYEDRAEEWKAVVAAS
ncbi:MAG: tetratricopeptide repeat protein, partial [Candidatus Sulfomarinibacteraceae bacterium]